MHSGDQLQIVCHLVIAAPLVDRLFKHVDQFNEELAAASHAWHCLPSHPAFGGRRTFTQGVALQGAVMLPGVVAPWTVAHEDPHLHLPRPQGRFQHGRRLQHQRGVHPEDRHRQRRQRTPRHAAPRRSRGLHQGPARLRAGEGRGEERRRATRGQPALQPIAVGAEVQGPEGPRGGFKHEVQVPPGAQQRQPILCSQLNKRMNVKGTFKLPTASV